MQRRFISTETAAAWTSRIGKHINPIRNEEIMNYQTKLKMLRKSLLKEREGQPTNGQLESSKKADRLKATQKLWNARLENTKENFKLIVDESHGKNLTQKHHPCRPTIQHLKTESDRAAGEAKLAAALRPALVMRRKYVKFLAETAQTWVTRENLAGKIEQAIASPSNYDVPLEKAVSDEILVRAKLAALRVPDDLDRE